MKYSEFEEILYGVFGIAVGHFEGCTYVDYMPDECGERFTISVIDEKEEGLCEINILDLSEIYDVEDRKTIIQTTVEYANTQINERDTEDKYHWRIKGDWNIEENVYLSLYSDEKGIFLSPIKSIWGKTKFTEGEFLGLAEKYGFVAEAFEKEPFQ